MTAKNWMTTCTWVATALITVLMIWMYFQGYFRDPQTLQALIRPMGMFGSLAFILLQAFQVVVPVIPGGMTCVLGVLCFGPVLGFVYNYIGIVLGSELIFYLVKTWGHPFVQKMLKPETYEHYIGWLDKGKKFELFFAFAIFAPCAPDDALCLIAGLTNMSYLKYTLIILLGKPLALLVYSMGLTSLLQLL